ncbi:MAG: DUF5667 domain-containing protein [Dehalococcoidales bacterium]
MNKMKEFDNILNDCLERILTEGETIERCLERYPEQAAELEPLLQTSLFAKKASAISPRPEFRERARYQLRAALQEMEEKKARRFSLFSWQPRWATVVVSSVLILLLASSGTVAAAGNSMPDETLYPVKLATETVRLALTPSTIGKAELYVKLADKRVAEIIRMAEKSQPEQVERVARRLNAYLAQAANLAASLENGAVTVMAPPPEALEAPVLPAEKAAPEKEAVIMAPAPPGAAEEAPTPSAAQAPPEKETEVRVAPERLVPREAPALAPAPEAAVPSVRPAMDDRGGVGGGDVTVLDKRARLRAILIRRAKENPEALRAALASAPESVKRALRRAIATSDAEYQRVLEILKERNQRRTP